MERTATGRTVADAIATAAGALDVEPDLCRVEVLEEPGRGGLFGLRAPRDARVRVIVAAGKAMVAARFLGRLVHLMGIDVEIEQSEEDDAYLVTLTGEDAAALIGHHGQTLDALQVLAEACGARRCDDRRRLTVDVNAYRQRRRHSLEDLARRAAVQVKRYGRPIELDAMSAAERRIVHLTLQAEAGIVTESTGDPPRRRVVIRPAE